MSKNITSTRRWRFLPDNVAAFLDFALTAEYPKSKNSMLEKNKSRYKTALIGNKSPFSN